jgi:hypothetical protein
MLYKVKSGNPALEAEQANGDIKVLHCLLLATAKKITM